MDYSGGHQMSFQFQLGLVRDRVTVEDSSDLTLGTLKSLAADFVADKHPQNGLTRLNERILLFRHNYDSTNILQVLPTRLQSTQPTNNALVLNFLLSSEAEIFVDERRPSTQVGAKTCKDVYAMCTCSD